MKNYLLSANHGLMQIPLHFQKSQDCLLSFFVIFFLLYCQHFCAFISQIPNVCKLRSNSVISTTFVNTKFLSRKKLREQLKYFRGIAHWQVLADTKYTFQPYCRATFQSRDWQSWTKSCLAGRSLFFFNLKAFNKLFTSS